MSDESLIQVHEIMAYPKAAYETISKYDTPKIGRVPLLMVSSILREKIDSFRYYAYHLLDQPTGRTRTRWCAEIS